MTRKVYRKYVGTVILFYGKQVPIHDEDGEEIFTPVSYKKARKVFDMLNSERGGYSLKDIYEEGKR